MLHKYINYDLFTFLKTKVSKLDCCDRNSDGYWIFDVCDQTIREHCLTTVFNKES